VSVRWVGAQRDVLAGDVSGKTSLGSLAGLSHLYALGPRAGVSGEITVFDGEPTIARVLDGQLRVETSADHEACFLVYDQVEAWHETVQRQAIEGEAAVEAAVLKAARDLGIEGADPFVFLIRAAGADVTFHVLDKRDDLPHTPALHERAKIRFEIQRQAVEVLGFYSSRHRGIFTPKDSDLHMHLRTLDGRASGHVEKIAVEPGAAIAVPRKETR
jgi:acetolactate decarboxylase